MNSEEKFLDALLNPSLGSKAVKNARDAFERRKAITAQVVQATYATETGRDFIRWLVVESRMFALGLGVIDNLRKNYQMSSDYYTGQMDLVKKIMEFLTPEQVADLTAAIVKKKTEMKKELKNGSD
jgi:hypothetical protein